MAEPLHTQRGFTLIEILVVVAITAVLLGLSAPSLRGLYQNWQVQKSVNAMESTLLYARSEAVRRGGQVAMQRETGGDLDCKATDAAGLWHCGWFLFVDVNGNGSWDSTEARVYQVALQKGISVRNSQASVALSFDRYGLVTAVKQVNTELFVFAPSGSTDTLHTRVLCMDTSGILRSSRATSCT